MAAKPPTIEEQWNKISQSGNTISTIPDSIVTLFTWVYRVAERLKGIRTNADQLGQDPFTGGSTLDDNFGLLQGGKLMNALANNNDCLIHSFLSCVCPIFRKYEATIRSKIASFFRRMMMIQLEDVDINKLKSSEFLDTNDLSLLCKHFKVQFIIVKKGEYPFDRHVEIYPEFADVEYAWRDAQPNGPFYVIHGTGVHFTPVAWNNNYELTNYTIAQFRTLAETVNKAAEEDRDANEARKIDTQHEINRILKGYHINEIKTQIDAAKIKEEKQKILSQYVAQLVKELDKHITTLDPKKYRQDYARYIAFHSIVAALTEDNSGSSNNSKKSNESMSLATQASEFEPGMGLDHIIEESIRMYEEKERERAAANANLNNAIIKSQTPNGNNADLQTAIELSKLDIMHSIQDGIKQGNINSTVTASVSEKQQLLRTMSVRARIGTGIETEYSAKVYRPIVLGGKRNTKKVKQAKKQKTKKTKRVRN